MKKSGIHTLRSAAAILLCLILTASCCGCGNGIKKDPNTAEDSIKIAVFEPLTGKMAEAAADEVAGIQLAHQLYGSALGKTVELVYADNKSDMDLTRAVATELVKEDISVVLGSYSNILSIASKEIFAEAGIPSIAVTCTNPLVTAGSKYSSRICYVDSFQGVGAAKYVYEELGWRSATVIKTREDDYCNAMALTFEEKLIALTGNDTAVERTIEYPAGTEDFTAVLDRLPEEGAHVVFLPVNAKDAAAIVQQDVARGGHRTFIGTERLQEEDVLQYGEGGLKNLYFTSAFAEEAELTSFSEAFKTAYTEQYGEDSRPSEAMALGFDAYIFALSAIETAGSASPGAVAESILAMKGFNGVTGSITLDENGDPIRSVVVKQVDEVHQSYSFENAAEPLWGDGTQDSNIVQIEGGPDGAAKEPEDSADGAAAETGE